MSLLREIIQLLGQAPGNIVYHLLTLLLLQAIVGISFTQWQRNRANRVAGRFALGAAVIVIGRVFLLVLAFIANGVGQTTAVLPLAEQALNTITVLILLWAIVPRSPSLPRLNDLALLIGTLIVTVISFSFLPSWLMQANAGVAYYSTGQSTLWTVVQLGFLLVGLLLILLNGETRRSLRPMIVGVMALVTTFHLIGFPALLPAETNIAYWVRFGHLIAFPLWAVLAYQHALRPLLHIARQTAFEPNWVQAFRFAGDSLNDDPMAQLTAVVQLINSNVDASIVALGIVDEKAPDQLQLVTNQPQSGSNNPRSWHVTVNEWSVLQAALNQRQTIEINSSGAGANQLERFAEKLELGELASLLIYPIIQDRLPDGIIVLGQRDALRFSDETKERVVALAGYVGPHLRWRKANRDSVAIVAPTSEPPRLPDSDEAISGRLIALEQERNKLRASLETAQNKLRQSDSRTAEAMERARDLALSLEVMEKEKEAQSALLATPLAQLEALETERDRLVEKLEIANLKLLQSETNLAESKKKLKRFKEKQQIMPENGRLAELEREVATLRESLDEAEEAMAMAAAGEGAISTEWVMLTITRYSGQLEQAQAQIESLETKLARQQTVGMDEVLVGVLQELRTPMTSIAGFTDLLLGGTLGNMGVKQRETLQRIKANTDRMEALLEQIRQLTPDSSPELTAATFEQIDVREGVETAVNAIMTQIREKRIHLDLNIDESLPSMMIKRNDFHQIVTGLLLNACQASGVDGHIAITAVARDWNDKQNDQAAFIELKISDSGDGISPEDLAHVFTAHYNPEKPLIAGVGDTTVGLSMAHSLTIANGGRLWVDSEKGKGSVFSLLFPLTSAQFLSANGSNA